MVNRRTTYALTVKLRITWRIISNVEGTASDLIPTPSPATSGLDFSSTPVRQKFSQLGGRVSIAAADTYAILLSSIQRVLTIFVVVPLSGPNVYTVPKPNVEISAESGPVLVIFPVEVDVGITATTLD